MKVPTNQDKNCQTEKFMCKNASVDGLDSPFT